MQTQSIDTKRKALMKKTIIASILIAVIVTCGSAFMVSTAEPGDPFLKGSGKIIHAIRDYQHSISSGHYNNFEEDW